MGYYPGTPDYMDPNAFIGASNLEIETIGAARSADAVYGFGHTQVQIDSLGAASNPDFSRQIAFNAAAAAQGAIIASGLLSSPRSSQSTANVVALPPIELTPQIGGVPLESSVALPLPRSEAVTLPTTEQPSPAPAFDKEPSELWAHHTKGARKHREKIEKAWLEKQISITQTAAESLESLDRREKELVEEQRRIQQTKLDLLEASARDRDPARGHSKQFKHYVGYASVLASSLEHIAQQRQEARLIVEIAGQHTEGYI